MSFINKVCEPPDDQCGYCHLCNPDLKSPRLSIGSVNSIISPRASHLGGHYHLESLEKPVNWPLVYTALIAIQVVNALYTVTVKAALEVDVNPVIFSFYRDIIAFPILQVAAFWRDGLILPERGIMIRLVILGLTGVMGNQILYILGLSFISSTEASVISQSQPMFAALLAAACGLEKFGWQTGLGLLLVFIGAAVIVGPGCLLGGLREGHVSSDLVGVALVLCSAVCMALYYVMQKPVLKVYPPLSVTAWTYMAGAWWMGLAALPSIGKPGQWLLAPSGYYALALAVLGNSCLKYSLQSYCNKNLSVVVLTVWGSMVPVLTASLAYFILHEDLTVMDLGAIPITLGLGIVTWARRDNRLAVNPKEPLLPAVKSFASLNNLRRDLSNGDLESLLGDFENASYTYNSPSPNRDDTDAKTEEIPNDPRMSGTCERNETAGLTTPLLGQKK